VVDATNVSVTVTVEPDAMADDEETAALSGQVRSMLADHDFDVSARPDEAAAPSGAKVGDAVSINSLVVTLAASGGALTALVGAVQAWLQRSSVRQVVVEINGDRLEVNGVTSEERRQLTTAWLARHEPGETRSKTDGG
jgi:hypothetical protein